MFTQYLYAYTIFFKEKKSWCQTEKHLYAFIFVFVYLHHTFILLQDYCSIYNKFKFIVLRHASFLKNFCLGFLIFVTRIFILFSNCDVVNLYVISSWNLKLLTSLIDLTFYFIHYWWRKIKDYLVIYLKQIPAPGIKILDS